MGKTPFHRQAMGLDEAVMYGYLVHKYSEAVMQKRLRSDGFFYVSLNDRFHHAPLDLDLQDTALIALQKRGYIKVKTNQSTGKRYYKLFVDKLLRDVRFI